MRYKSGYKAEKRQELLNISGQLAKKNGFQATGIDRFMKQAGVTSGAFYSHFSSKNDLFKNLIENELQQSFALWQENPFEDAEQWLDFEMNRYLTLSHLERPDHGCVLPTLASEVARADLDIRQAFQAEMQRGLQIFIQHLGSEDKAWAVLSQLVGAVLLARSVVDESVKILILESSKQNIKSML